MLPVGVYRELCKSKPNAESIIDHISSTPYPEKEALLKYMKNAETQLMVTSVSIDVIDGVSRVYGGDRKTDGMFCWNTCIEYYIDKYNLRPPEDFIAHVMEKMGKA